MSALSDMTSSDPVSEMLRAVRIRTVLYARPVWRAPWGVGVQAFGTPAFHVVTGGSCWLEVEGEPRQIRLADGDLVVLPTGPRHWMRSRREAAVLELGDILAASPRDADGRFHAGGRGARTSMVCGRLSLMGGRAHPQLDALKPAVVIRGVEGRPVPWLAATLDLLNAEARSDAPGALEVLSRLADALLTQALRVAFADLVSAGEIGGIALRDPEVAAAVELIQSQPERAWRVRELAAAAALSPSAFSARFRLVVGESPKRYITRSRLAHAASLLDGTDATLAEVAASIGYATEFSFAKAFKREFEIAPGAYRGRESA